MGSILNVYIVLLQSNLIQYKIAITQNHIYLTPSNTTGYLGCTDPKIFANPITFLVKLSILIQIL